MAIWDDVVDEQTRLIYEKAGFGLERIGFGKSPALVIIDVQYAGVGDKPEPILKSMERFPLSCGEEGWKAVRNISSLLPLARKKRIPIIYVAHDTRPKPKGWIPKKMSQKVLASLAANADIVREIAPAEGEVVIYKTRSSMFYGTAMLATLIGLGVDTLLVCGTATGGCVRASVEDAHNNNFRVILIEECTFDRAPLTHKVNLFEMNLKYCDVLSIAEIKEYLEKL